MVRYYGQYAQPPQGKWRDRSVRSEKEEKSTKK